MSNTVLGPAHPWLVTAYAESVPYPSGSAFAQELFESGHIPGDTDYRIYRDFGEVPGSRVRTAWPVQLDQGVVIQTAWPLQLDQLA